MSTARTALHEARTNTPLRPLTVHHAGARWTLWLKLEQHNPTGSIKYRTAVGLVAALDAELPLTPGTRIVESTSGNLGVALATVLAARGCRFIAVVDPKLSPELRQAMQSAGATVVAVHEPDPYGGYLLTRLRTVQEMCAADPQLRWADQYNSPANPLVHRETLAAEIHEQTGGLVDAALVAVSTGGTLAGLSAGLRSLRSDIRLYAVDVHGSLVTGGPGAPHLLTGVGATRQSTLLDRTHYDQAVRVRDVDAFAYGRMLADDTGLAVGGSSGAVLAAFAAAVAARRRLPRCAVAVMPDGGAGYRSTFYDDGWLAARGVAGAVYAAQAQARAEGVKFEWDGEPR